MASHTPAFFGRINELQFLKDHWELAKQGKPQIVNIIADTGVGKTRLVHEFYHWLASESSSSDDDYGYWPKNLGVGRQRVVNPPLDLFKAFEPKKDTIPWLWWGMYWTDADGENECALIRSHEYIQAHVDMLSIDKRFKASTAQAIMEWVKEEGLSHVVEWIPGGSQILNLGGLFKKIRKSKKEKLAMESGIGEQSKNRLESLASDLIRDFSDVLSVKKTGGDVVPMVVFLDDIQFATDYSHDAFALEFLERLLNQSVSEGWPLMVIATHWRAEWLEHSQPKQEINFKPWRHVIDGVSGKIHVSELKLEKIPVADLRNVMLDILPGLDRDVQERILGRVDNVRWLVEVLNALRDDVENFLNGDRTKSLSDFGVNVTLSSLLKHSGYLDVIRHRLTNDSMRELRHILGAMAWNTPGLSFISELAKGFGQELMKHGILQSEGESPEQRVMYLLMQAIDPGSLVDGLLINNDIPSTISFPERGYLEIAKELFHTDRLHAMRIGLGNEVIDWLSDVDESGDARWRKLPSNSDRKVFLEIAYNVLGQLKPQLSDEQINELSVIEKTLRKQLERGNLEEQDFHDLMNEAKEEYIIQGEGALEKADYWQVVAGVELVVMLHDDWQGRAYELAYELAEYPFIYEFAIGLSNYIFYSLVEIWSENADLLGLVRSLLVRRISDKEELFSIGKNFLELKDLNSARFHLALLDERDGLFDDALEGFRDCLASSEMISSVDFFQGLHYRLYSQAKLSDLYSNSGNFKEAIDGYERCLKIAGILVKENPSDLSRLDDLIVTYYKLGNCYGADSNSRKARYCFECGLELVDTVFELSGEAPSFFHNSIGFNSSLANLDANEGDIDSALVRCQYGLDLNVRLIAEYGKSPERLESLCRCYINLAMLEAGANKIDESRLNNFNGIDVAAELIKDFGVNSARLMMLKTAQFNLASLEKDMGNFESARACFKSCSETIHQMREQGDYSIGLLNELNTVLYNIRLLNWAESDGADYLVGLAEDQYQFAMSNFYDNNFSIARENFLRALGIYLDIVDRYGFSSVVLSGISINQYYLACIDHNSGVFESAAGYIQESLHYANVYESFVGKNLPFYEKIIKLYYSIKKFLK
ncbi:hypothetical protein [Shewanella sp.]|uniref:hypothetical protein n=1 Tax=Shewanella sp. TaxID=50422 RepID=UPI0040545447